jgi:2-dehydro-3-deoxyphosphogluconate aldolase/(4S)-4-hydroxy-2-oxoglutarate aldolase
MVKVFPASVFGPKYIRELKAPLDKIELMAVGGVSDQNIKEFFSNGASAIAFGAGIFKRKWLENSRYDNIEKAIRSLIDNYKSWRSDNED